MSDTKVVLARDGFAPPRVFAGASAVQVAFSFAAMLGMCLVAWMFYALRPFNVDPDIWWHIEIGQRILETHQWPTVEQYSFTAAGQHWRAYEWLGEVLLAVVYRTGGLRGLGALLILLGALFALALYYYATIRCGNPKAGFLGAAVLLCLANWFNLRPQMLGYLFLLFTLIILERFRQPNSRAIWLLPPIILLWVNTHGSWIIGLGAIGVYLVSGMIKFHMGSAESRLWNTADRRHLTIVFMLSLIAVFITPYGAGIATFPFQISLSKVNVSNIQEWHPMVFNLPSEKLFLCLILGSLLALATLRRKWRLEEFGLFLFAALMACLHERFLALFVPFAVPVLVVILARWVPKYERGKEIYALNAAIIVGMLAAMVWYFPSRSAYASIVAKSFPVAAVQYLNTHFVPGPMYNAYFFGGYLMFARGPEHKVFIDGRGEVYEPAGVLSDAVELINLHPGSLAVLQKYNIQSCLLQSGEALATVLSALPEWQKVYDDGTSVLFVRRQSDGPDGPEVHAARTDHAAGGIINPMLANGVPDGRVDCTVRIAPVPCPGFGTQPGHRMAIPSCNLGRFHASSAHHIGLLIKAPVVDWHSKLEVGLVVAAVSAVPGILWHDRKAYTRRDAALTLPWVFIFMKLLRVLAVLSAAPVSASRCSLH